MLMVEWNIGGKNFHRAGTLVRPLNKFNDGISSGCLNEIAE